MPHRPRTDRQGPFHVDQLREGDRYELSSGHPIYCAPSGREHAGTNLIGAAALESDPDVEWAGVDAGFTPDSGTLRAPDVAIGQRGAERGWIPGAPPLAVEYAARGQDEQELQDKIAELLQSGTQQVWVVRLIGPRRVEVYRPGETMRLVGPGEILSAPGLLRNPVPIEALYDRDAAHRATLRNLLQREGYESLDAVRQEGIVEGINQGISQGIAESILALLTDRELVVDPPTRERILGEQDLAQLMRWLIAATQVQEAQRLLD
ncbi:MULTISPECIES: Uma2 family endonuclease [unclassified Thiocapsa]|uniref:Uma2 family endonuclease n=1 Tax=unclassified Thiocapsa TaxID=2641286 RepID=UPI0035B2B8C4